MKKLLVLSLITTMSMSTLAFANSPMKPVEPTTEVTAVTPIIAVDRETLEDIVPAREFAEGIGYTVTWNAEDKSITYTKGENTFISRTGSNEYYADVLGSEPKVVELQTKQSIKDGKAYIPVSFTKMLRDVPVVDPVKPVTPITPTLPVIEQPESTIDFLDNGVDALMDTEIAKTIADDIDSQVSELEKQQAEFNEQYKQDYLTNGGEEDKYIEPSYEIGYEILTQDDSFVKVNVYRIYDNGTETVNENNVTLYDIKTGETVSIER